MYYFFLICLIASAECSRTKLEILNQMFQCISNTVPEDHWGGKLFAADFLPTISIQWNNQNKFNYLHWPVYEGPDDWQASCHSSEAMKSCLTPLINGTVGLNDLDKNIAPALFTLHCANIKRC